MGVHLQSISEINDHPISEYQAAHVYLILTRNPDEHLAVKQRERWEALFAEGAASPEIARTVVGVAYRWHEQAMLLSSLQQQSTKEMCLDIYAAVGIEPPEHPGYIGHGSHS